ncbi:UNVERIFIED_CONTAM: hypothetical protein Sangu_2989000 [Sesamum angustifolium]|uniref:Uncharacterized protein n=1 Tax=Sesamum angustifolium TaxID=2727405 RepID=A0AAW2KNV5_9LAMI
MEIPDNIANKQKTVDTSSNTQALQEQVAALAPIRVATRWDVDANEEEAEGDIPIALLPGDRRQGAPPLPPQDIPPQCLARFECLYKGL